MIYGQHENRYWGVQVEQTDGSHVLQPYKYWERDNAVTRVQQLQQARMVAVREQLTFAEGMEEFPHEGG